MKVVFYGLKNQPVVSFIEKLDSQEQVRIIACLRSIEELGFECPRVEFKQVLGKLWEIKIKIRTIAGGYRIFYVALGKNILVLLHAYKKKSQKAPKKEIEISQKRLKEVLKNESTYFK